MQKTIISEKLKHIFPGINEDTALDLFLHNQEELNTFINHNISSLPQIPIETVHKLCRKQ